MKKYEMKTPDGTKDVFLEDLKRRRQNENLLKEIFVQNNYFEVATPIFEYFDLFSTGIGKIAQNEMYCLTETTGNLIVLRPDSTKPIARLVSTRLKNAKLPLKLFYNQPVYKRNIRLNRKNDEIMQFGGELIGINGIDSDVEIIRLCCESFKKFGSEFLIEIGHIGIFKSIIKNLSSDFAEKMRELVFNKNFPALDNFSDKISADTLEKLKKLTTLFGKEEVFQKATNIFIGSESLYAISYLQNLYKRLKELNLDNYVSFDLGIVNDYDYYTGIVFKGYVNRKGDAVLSGGRYDTLYKSFGLEYPAIGFAFNVDEL